MTPRRPPTAPSLDDTIDEADQPRAVDRSGRFERVASGVRDPFFDAGPDDPTAPENVDLADRLTLLEQHRRADVDRIAEAHQLAHRAGTWNRRIFYALSGLSGIALTALGFAISIAHSSGDEAGTRRAQAIERARYITIIDQLVKDVSRHDGILGSLVDAIRTRYPIGSLPLVGPAPQPSPQDHAP